MTSATNRGAVDGPDAPLSLAEHDLILNVLTDCASTRTVDEFREAALESLSWRLGYRTATVFSGSSFSTVFTDVRPLHTGRAVGMFRDYRDFWFRDDFFATTHSRRLLQSTRVASFGELGPVLPPRAHTFVADFFQRGGLTTAVALYLQVSEDQNSLVGLFGRQDSAKERRDAYLLRRLAGPLNAMSRSLVAEVERCDATSTLTPRQREVAVLIGEGLGNAAIADLLVVQEDTVKKYVSAILAALRCESRTQVALLVRAGRPAPRG